MTAVSAFMPSAAKSVVFGSRSAPAPKITAPRRNRLQPGFEQVPQRPHVARPRRRARSAHAAAAAPNAAMPATFSVPARKPRSWPPPRISGSARWMSSLRAHQRADALRAADLVRRQRQKIGAERRDIAGDPPGRLHGIDMEQAAARMHDRGRLRDRLHHAGLVIREHQRDQRPRRFRDGRRPAPRGRCGRRRRPGISSIASRGNRPPARTEACSMAESKSRERGRFSACGLDRRRQRQHIGFGAARGEKHVARPRPDQRGDLFARVLDQAPRGAALGMHRGRIAGNATAPAPRPRAPRAAAARWRSSRNSCASACDGACGREIPPRSALWPELVPRDLAATASECLLFVPRPVLEVATQCLRRRKHVASSKKLKCY